MSDPPESSSQVKVDAGPARRILRFLEWALSLGLLGLCIFENWVVATHGGGFWRDEANSVQLASWLGILENWRAVWLDAHPVGYALVLKPFLFRGLDHLEGLRWVGFGTSLLVFVTLWLLCYSLGGRPPLLLFALLALNHYAIRFTANLRPYGAVTLLLLLLLWCWYRRASGESRRWGWAAAALSAAAVNCLYAAVMPCAVLGFGATALVWRREGKRGGTGALAAVLLGLAPLGLYLPALHRARYWADFVSYPAPTFPPLWGAFTEVLDTQGTPLRLAWAVALLLGLPLAAHASRRNSEDQTAAAFASLTVIIVPLVAALLYFGRTLTAAWYFVPALTLLTSGLEITSARLARDSAVGRWLILMGTVGLVAWAVRPETSLLQIRQTNMDLVAARLNSETGPRDLVVLGNALHGVSFGLYYRGRAPWMTVPPISDHRIHRFDQIKDELSNPRALEPVLSRITSTLTQGGTVYLVGEVAFDPGFGPVTQASSFDAAMGGWNNTLAQFLGQHAGEARRYQVEGETPVLPFEHPPLIVVHGWR